MRVHFPRMWHAHRQHAAGGISRRHRRQPAIAHNATRPHRATRHTRSALARQVWACSSATTIARPSLLAFGHTPTLGLPRRVSAEPVLRTNGRIHAVGLSACWERTLREC